MASVMLVDDHPLFRAGLAVLLDAEPDLKVVQAHTATEAIDLVQREAIEVALLDVWMPTMSGVSLTCQLLELSTSCKIIALSAVDDPVIVAAMLRAGAAGYALKTQPPSEIVDAIRAVHAGARYLAPQFDDESVLALVDKAEELHIHRLTRRERRVFDLLIRGYSNDEIGSTLFISRRTVETHRFRISTKLATHSIVDMIRIAARYGALRT